MRWWTRPGAAWLGAAILLPLLAAPSACQGAAPIWQRAQTAHFTLYSTADSTALFRTAQELERMAEVIQLWGLGSPTALRSKVVLIGLPDKKSYAPHQPVVGSRRQDTAGYVMGLPVGYWIGYREDDPSGRAVAHHEYSHTLLDERYQSVPLCLNEGLAEYLSTFASTQAACRLGGDIPGHRYLLNQRTPFPLDALFAVTPDSPVYRGADERTQLFYAESWALVHYLMQTHLGGGDRFKRLLATIADGTPPRAAFAAVYPQAEWATLPDRLQAYTDAGELKGPEIAFAGSLAAIAIDLQPARPAEVAVQLGLWRAMNADVAGEATTALLHQGQAEPGLAPLAAAGRGLMAWAADDLDAALPQFRAAAAGNPADALTLAIAGLGVLQVAASREGAVQDSLVLEAYRILSRSVVLDATHTQAQRGHEECADFLRARAEAAQARSQQQDDPAIRKANIKYNAGIVALNGADFAHARDIFTRLSESAPDSTLRAMATARLADIADFEAFDRALAAAKANDFEGALRIFERLAAQAGNPQLRNDAATNARMLRATRGG